MEVTDYSVTPWLYLLGPEGLRDDAPWICFKLYSRKQSQPVNSFLINHCHVLWPKWYLYCFWKIKKKKKKTPKSVVNTFEDTHCLLGKAQNLSLVQDHLPFQHYLPITSVSSLLGLGDPSPSPSAMPLSTFGPLCLPLAFLECFLLFPISLPFRPNSNSLASSNNLCWTL